MTDIGPDDAYWFLVASDAYMLIEAHGYLPGEACDAVAQVNALGGAGREYVMRMVAQKLDGLARWRRENPGYLARRDAGADSPGGEGETFGVEMSNTARPSPSELQGKNPAGSS